MRSRATSAPFDGLLAEAGRLLAASLDLDDTLRTIARLAVPEFSDWAAVDVLEPDGAVRQVSSGHADPAKDAFLLELRGRHRAQAPDGGEKAEGALDVARTGEPRIWSPAPAGRLPLRSPAEIELYEAIGPVSWLVVPLHAGGESIGALTLLSTRPDRVYGEQDLPVALELADRCGQALRNARLYDQARSGLALLDAVFAAAPIGMSLLDTEQRVVLRNARMAALDAPIDPERIASVIATGTAAADTPLQDGARTFLASYAPVESDGRVVGVVTAVVETTERERLLHRTERLQAVTEQLSAALTEQAVADVILGEGIAAAGATCGVLGLLAPEHQALRIEYRVGLAGGPVNLMPLDAPAPMPGAARAGAPVLVGSRADWLERFPHAPPRSEFEAFAAVPLMLDERVIGVMGLGFPEVRAFDDGDVEMLVAIARQGAQALDRGRLYGERAYVAQTLQAGLLPRALPEVEGLELAVRYRPIGDGSEVGGDFYDVVGLPGGAWLAAVGDICGKGTAAAVLTGVMRSTIRALALREDDVVELVRGVNEALRREPSADALASLACATIRADGDGFAVRLASGGHPPPLILRAGGDLEIVASTGPMLGWRAEPDFVTATARLGAGDLVLLYTDGVIDARRAGGEPFGEARLQQALAGAVGLDAQGVLDRIDEAVRVHAPGPPRDDKALLAVRVRA